MFNPPALRYGGKISVNWREYISKNGWTSDLSFGPTGCVATMVIDINFTDMLQFVQDSLGYSFGFGGAIVRVLPWQHPLYPWLYATRITGVQGIQPLGVSAPNANGSYSTYSMYRCTVAFEGRPYRLDPVGGISASPWTTYTEYQIQPSTEFLTRDTGYFRYCDAQFASGPALNAQFTSPTNLLIQKERITWVWHEVPARGAGGGLFDTNNRSLNIESRIGTVNVDAFSGYGPDTLLLEGVNFEPYQMPYDFAGVYKTGGPAQYYKVTFHFIYFNPPCPLPAPSSNGHNLAPYSDGSWYPVQYKQTTKLKYSRSTFSNLFLLNLG